MEQNFQTSFIPKKIITEDKNKYKQSLNLYFIISIFIFLAVFIFFLFLYFYSIYLSNDIKNIDKILKTTDSKIETNALISYQELDKRLKVGNDLLNSHIIVSPIFQILQEITTKNITFTDFYYSLDDKNNVFVKTAGEAISYRALALQSDLFSDNKNFKEPVFSSLSLGERGNILFNLEFYVDKDLVNYKRFNELRKEN